MDKKEKREQEFYDRLEKKGVSRRDFMKFCTFLTATMGLSASYVTKVAKVFAAPQKRTPVVWLHFAECTGCSESLLRTMYPWVDEVVLEILSLEYHETIMAAAGHQAEENLQEAINKYKGEFICVCEGAISTKDGGVYGKIGGRTFLEVAKDVVPKAKAVIAVGQCACYGGVQAAAPNPGGFKGVKEALNLKRKEIIHIPGCPPNPINMVATIANYLLLGKLPQVDSVGRPLFAYGKTVHDQCPRRSHFEMGEFAPAIGSPEAEKGWCLYELGFRGPMTYNNCPTAKYNDGTSWPVEAGHPCIGCSEPNFWDYLSPFYEPM